MADNVTTQTAALATVPSGGTYRFRELNTKLVQVIAPEAGALTDGSGDIVAADTSEQVFAANTSRVYLLVQNVSDTDMWVDFGTAAVKDQPSVLLKANGGSIVFEGAFVPTSAVNIICGTIGKPYTAKEA